MTKKSTTRLLCLAALLLGIGSAALWWSGLFQASGLKPQVSSSPQPPPATGIVTTATDSHQAVQSYSPDGDTRRMPADPALSEALSHTSRLDYALRLKAVHALYGTVVGPEQSATLRAFVADPAIPEGLDIRQIRALKNDVLNVLGTQPGEEAATAAMLRALHADEGADPGLRDYALQHLAALIERDPSIGWETHWTAIEGPDPALAATAMLHLLAQERKERGVRSEERASAQVSAAALQLSSFRSQVFSSASPSLDSGLSALDSLPRLAHASLRLASDPTAPDPARTTALQVCGQLRLAEARPLALELARSARAGMPLRIAAIATLGDLGGDADTQAFLAALATGPERRLRVPAQSALQRFSIN